MREETYRRMGIHTICPTTTIVVPDSQYHITAADRETDDPRKGAATMYLIVVGGGKVGYYLTKTLVNEGYEVLLIEKNPAKWRFTPNASARS